MNAVSEPTRILIADDHPLVIGGLTALISDLPEMKVIGSCSDGIAALTLIKALEPNIALVDLHMPGLTGLEILTEITRLRIPTAVVLLTAQILDRDVSAAIDAGASAIVYKSDAPQDLFTCLKEVSAKRQWFARAVEEAIEREALRRLAGTKILNVLTERELQITRLAAKNFTNKSIAGLLYISEGTVKIHLYNIYSKLGIKNRAALTDMVATILLD